LSVLPVPPHTGGEGGCRSISEGRGHGIPVGGCFSLNRCSVVCALNLWITFFIHNEADFRPLLRYDLPPFLPRLPHVLERNCVLSGGPPLASRSRTMCGCSGIFTYRWSDGCSVGVPVAQCRRRGGRLRGPGRGVVISAPSPAWCVCGVRGHSALGAGGARGWLLVDEN